jgi:hypothetical protein
MSVKRDSQMNRDARPFIVVLIALVSLYSFSQWAAGEEGFFRPEQIATPFDKARVLRSIVRIRSHVYWDAVVFGSDAEAAVFRRSFQQYKGSGRKTYLPEGVVLWHVILSKDELDKIRQDPGQREQPGLFEIVHAFEGISAFPTEKIVPEQGYGTGVFVSREGRFVTNYHIMREEIEADDRTSGSAQESTCRFTSFEVAVLDHDRIVGWRPLTNVKLLKNLSAAEWQGGFDGALLQADEKAPAFLRIAKGLRNGEELWHFGFPMRSRRDPARLSQQRYTDADGTLRVSHGTITQIQDHNFISDADSFSGSSGSPAVSRAGDLLGYVWNVYPDAEFDRRATVFQGGTIYVTAIPIAKKLGF